MQFGILDWPLFISAGLLLNLTPGVDMALVLRCSAGQGFRAGAAAALGVGAGCGLHIALSALGLGALLAGSPLAFGLLRWAGAGYLVWLGWGLIRPLGGQHQNLPDGADALQASSSALAQPATPWRQLFGQGFLTNALNPKVAMFFLAFVPQFIAADSPHKSAAFGLLGAVFVVNATAVNLALAWAAASLRQRLGTDQARQPALQAAERWLNRGVGALFVALGLRLALGEPLR